MPNVKRTEMTVFSERLFCDCGEEMVLCGQADEIPPKYLHECPKCKAETYMDDEYPREFFAPKDEVS